MDVEYMVTTSSPMDTLNFKWQSHIYTHAAALDKIPILWCEKQLTTWMVPGREIQIDESLYAGQYAAREAAISIMTKAGSQSSNVIKDQLEKHHATANVSIFMFEKIARSLSFGNSSATQYVFRKSIGFRKNL